MKLEVSKRVVVRDVISNGEDREVLNKVTFEQRRGKSEGIKPSKGNFQEKGKIKT